MYLYMFMYVYMHMYALQFSKTFKLLFLKIDSFNVSDYDYEMLLVQGLVAENYVNVKKL